MSQPKVGVIYLIINLHNIKNNVTPFLYVGSKADSRKFSSYWSSSKYVKDDVEKFGVESFAKVILHKVSYYDIAELLEVELETQQKLSVLSNPAFYNRALANGKMDPNSAVGTVWMRQFGKNKRVPKEEVSRHLLEGYDLGRCENPNKDRVYISKGGVVKAILHSDLSLYLLDGWTQGRKGNKTGKSWINKDGKNKIVSKEEVSDYVTQGWNKGCIMKK